MARIAQRLRDLCVGHPHAFVPWPHRELHEAADALDEALAALRALKDATPVNPLHAYTKFTIPHSTFLACGAARERLEDDTLRVGDVIVVAQAGSMNAAQDAASPEGLNRSLTQETTNANG